MRFPRRLLGDLEGITALCISKEPRCVNIYLFSDVGRVGVVMEYSVFIAVLCKYVFSPVYGGERRF